MDALIIKIADYVYDDSIVEEKNNVLAFQTARLALLDSLACALLASQNPDCQAVLGPYFQEKNQAKKQEKNLDAGVVIPGTAFRLDPIQAAFDIGSLIRWLDFNDTWLGKEWAHPSDNLGGILAASCYMSLDRSSSFNIREVLKYQIKAYEIQGILALENAFNRVGLDHVILVKVATAAVTSKILGLSKDQSLAVLSQAWIDGQSLRTYRHAPNVGSRKSWAGGDATSRGLWLAWMGSRGMQGINTPLTAKTWGFQEVLFRGEEVRLNQSLGSYVMENILFKVAYPAEFHAQTALEAAINLHEEVSNRLDEIDRIEIETQEAAMRIINKTGPLHNHSDRDHSLQYIVAAGMIFGDLKAKHYSDAVAEDVRIDQLREKIRVSENLEYSKAYLDPAQRAIPNAVQVFFKDGSKTNKVEVWFPLGHVRRREEALPLLKQKFDQAIELCFNELGTVKTKQLKQFWESDSWLNYHVSEFLENFAKIK